MCLSTHSTESSELAAHTTGPRTRASWKIPRLRDIFHVFAIITRLIKIIFASKDGSDWCGGRVQTKMSAQKVESNHCASQRLQVWSLQPGPPNVIWTRGIGTKPHFELRWRNATCNSSGQRFIQCSDYSHFHRILSNHIFLNIVWNIQQAEAEGLREYNCTVSAAVEGRDSAADCGGYTDWIMFEYRPGSRVN